MKDIEKVSIKVYCCECIYIDPVYEYSDNYLHTRGFSEESKCDSKGNIIANYIDRWDRRLKEINYKKAPHILNKNNDCLWYEGK